MNSTKLIDLPDLFDEELPTNFGGVPGGFLPVLVSRILQQLDRPENQSPGLVFVASDGRQLEELKSALLFFAPERTVLELPAWDCLPYDRVSPSGEVSAQRIATLAKLAQISGDSIQAVSSPILVLTTANALVQRQIPRGNMKDSVLALAPGKAIGMDATVSWLSKNGFERNSSVHDRGEYAVRGGILDYFAPGDDDPVRLDFFGDTLESIRHFDIASQRTITGKKTTVLVPMSEVDLNGTSIAHFRRKYLELFGAATRDDVLYQAVSEGRRYTGIEHWLPLFHPQLDSLFDYFAGFGVICDHQTEKALEERLKQIDDHYQARRESLNMSVGEGAPYKPVEPDSLYLNMTLLKEKLAETGPINVSPFELPPSSTTRIISLGATTGHSFAGERESGKNVFNSVVDYAADQRGEGRTVILAAWSEGSRERLGQVLGEHGMERLRNISSPGELASLKKGETALAILPIETGFSFENFCFIAEQDILGDRLVRKAKRRKRAADFLSEVSSLSEGDIVVHVDHGIGRFKGLRTLEVGRAPHDCLEIIYASDDKLYLPVENIELLSRYGSSDSEVMLDRLGGAGWQSRKAKLKKRILEMAGQLIRIAAERALRSAEKMLPPQGLYDEFSARFPYDETEDQMSAIEAVLDDLGAGTPMDRLICGDVGFGKTEVALRGAFVAAMAGTQVAVVVPTTLLARQHHKSFIERFKGLPINVAHASRLVGPKSLAETKKGLASGSIDIVIGTHALLGQSINFKRLGLLIIDEEQRFGVKHKEHLKELKTDVHVLTLSATPIPRTLQLALTGVRELSLITTAPLDRLAVRTFVSPLDPLVIREALLRERYRGGQSFYVCPRVSDLEERGAFLREYVPELRFAIAHGQMSPGELDAVMNAFYDGQYDVLLSTTIVESGLDIPTANTLIVHRADMFGLAQLYQLRGRVGRSKIRAYALFTLPLNKRLTAMAERRLKVLQSLDTIGAGFELASHDLDIRGSGNLLGQEQSGQIREVGYELYQQMLEEAVAELKGGDEFVGEGKWSPQITIGTPVLIPDTYISDLQLRLNLYRRLVELKNLQDIEAFGAELIDRFGSLPSEVDHLLKIIYVKGMCVTANIEKLDAGPKGLVITFRNKEFANPAGLIGWISEQGSLAKIRPDQSVVLQRDFSTTDKQLKGVAVIVSKLAKMV
ncbi:MAG: transcription-repair coupling factor [Hyphomicrobiales bacterium]|nr:transcription-repair coupling factor [Hyphomicrobiales bacterium]